MRAAGRRDRGLQSAPFTRSVLGGTAQCPIRLRRSPRPKTSAPNCAGPRSSTTSFRSRARSRSRATKQLVNQRDLALAYSPGVAAPCEEIVKDPNNAFKYTSPRQPGRRDHQRHRGAGPGRHRPAGRQAGDGRQGRAVQEVRRHRRLRHRDRREGPGQAGRGDRRAGADLRRHQPRGHQGAGLLLRRAQAAQAHEDPGVPRRPARHRHHRGAPRCSTA